ncbi:invasion protein IalB [Bradyrhizobium sp. USDA 4538]|uniref:invasion associated locus B family protein n=1 Tax=unclassified Bradyrhizobium TaxID=2631580 RepID=UPI0020A1C331|nr:MULTISPECIES: invasion associated locus B family protein [unclassified Bradyrhizobium]MCP1845987.1 invasion protein IalB [Bradyrhizobium sp. USDA 4538]MCP1907379.1 invasion protein IalB [Bradyrhizobium sp. USDA 4537]MCP1985165.1 invasion protein IalB [Bradyrhizobium sp. USDA 4539]
MVRTSVLLLAALFAGILFIGASPSNQILAQETTSQPTTIMETYDAWAFRCDARNADRQCQISAELFQDATNQKVLSILLRPAAKAGSLAGTITAAFGIKLSEGVTLKVGNKDFRKIELLTCLPNGCLATTEFNADEVKVLGTQQKVVVRMVTYDGGNPVDFELSMKGFGAALARLAKLAARPVP